MKGTIHITPDRLCGIVIVDDENYEQVHNIVSYTSQFIMRLATRMNTILDLLSLTVNIAGPVLEERCSDFHIPIDFYFYLC